MADLSRRIFLQSLGMAGAAGFVPSVAKMQEMAWGQALAHWDGSPMGRILIQNHAAYEAPDWRSKVKAIYKYNDVITVLGVEANGYGLYPSNNTWVLTDQGYVYTSWVQPVANVGDNPVVPVGEGGAWGEITIPIAYSVFQPADDAPTRERLYYGQVHRITATIGDYYEITEIYGSVYYIKAAVMRVIPPEEYAPISPDVDPGAKTIDISIRDQRLFAYEGDEKVYETLIASGMPDTPTPFGTYNIFDKRHGVRMVGGLAGGGYNLAGIASVMYFTKRWAALHSTYWHNDYGRRHSNGCVNMFSTDVKWLFRWTTPFADYYSFQTRTDAPDQLPGTQIKVRW